MIDYGKDNWTGNFFMQIDKLLWWQAWIQNPSLGSQIPEAYVGSRGLTDVMVWFYALYAHQEDEKFSIPEDFKEVFNLNPYLAGAQSMIGCLDAIILIGISQEEAKRRRKQAGKTGLGYVTDSPFFKDLNAWYGHLVREVLPRWHEFWGTGYLILNGENSLEKNAQRLQKFIRQTIVNLQS